MGPDERELRVLISIVSEAAGLLDFEVEVGLWLEASRVGPGLGLFDDREEPSWEESEMFERKSNASPPEACRELMVHNDHSIKLIRKNKSP